MDGRQRRRKGGDFERKVARLIRKKYPTATTRRSEQAARAYEPDVVIEGDAPFAARRLWLELEDSRKPSPRTKMQQARRDISQAYKFTAPDRAPAVVWHPYRKRTIYVTIALSDAASFGGMAGKYSSDVYDPDITMSLEDFLRMLPE